MEPVGGNEYLHPAMSRAALWRGYGGKWRDLSKNRELA